MNKTTGVEMQHRSLYGLKSDKAARTKNMTTSESIKSTLTYHWGISNPMNDEHHGHDEGMGIYA